VVPPVDISADGAAAGAVQPNIITNIRRQLIVFRVISFCMNTPNSHSDKILLQFGMNAVSRYHSTVK